MKDFLVTIYNGGDEAVAAVRRMGDDWRAQLQQAAAEIDAMRLTDAEREAIKDAIDCCEDITYGSENEPEAAATLRGLLERLK